MMWQPAGSAAEIEASVASFDRVAAGRLCGELIDYVRHTADVYPEKSAKRVLSALRRKRYFDLLHSVAEALIEAGQDAPVIRRLYAQALIDQGALTPARSVLQVLEAETRSDPAEHAEAVGLQGRLYKQLYVNGAATQADRRRDWLARAVDAYSAIYTLDPVEHNWHGINMVACLCRARRDRVDLGSAIDPMRLASEILGRIQAADAGALDVWRLATAAEACVALGDHDGALAWLARYVTRRDAAHGTFEADAFELTSTLRQLTEVWQLTGETDPGRNLLPLLHSQLLLRDGGEIAGAAHELRRVAHGVDTFQLEKVLGSERFKSFQWYLTGLDRSLTVALIETRFQVGVATGFLIPGAVIHPSLGVDPVLMTNAHVLSDDPQADDCLRPDQAMVRFEAWESGRFKVADVLWTSPGRLDVTLSRLCPDPGLARAFPPTPFPLAERRPPLDAQKRVYIIGHPEGKALSFSLQDNVLLDYDDRVVRYRAPTERGNSGSPVFDDEWNLIALHHGGAFALRGLQRPQTVYPANEGIWIEAIRQGYAQAHP